MEKIIQFFFYSIYKMYLEYKNTKVKAEDVDSALNKGQRRTMQTYSHNTFLYVVTMLMRGDYHLFCLVNTRLVR